MRGDCLDRNKVSQDTKYKVKFKHFNEKGAVVAIASSRMVEEVDSSFKHTKLRIHANELYECDLKGETKLDIVRPGRYDVYIHCIATCNAYTAKTNKICRSTKNGRVTLSMFFWVCTA